MEITLTPKTEAVVRKNVADRLSASPDDLIEAAVLLLDERDRLAYLRGLLLEAERQVQEGKFVEWTPELHLKWRREAQERSRQGVLPDPNVWP